MGPCNPRYREIVSEKEKKVNEQKNQTVPLFVKISSIIIVVAVLLILLSR